MLGCWVKNYCNSAFTYTQIMTYKETKMFKQGFSEAQSVINSSANALLLMKLRSVSVLRN